MHKGLEKENAGKRMFSLQIKPILLLLVMMNLKAFF
jgi:hypothetical protein